MKRLLNTLYVTNPDAVVRKKSDAISVKIGESQAASIPFHLLDGIVLFGHVGCSAALLAACAEHGLSVVLLDENGRFKARVEGPISGNVLLRREQYARALSEDNSLEVAKRFVAGKLHNSKVVLQRQLRDYPEENGGLADVLIAFDENLGACKLAGSLDELRGIEGDAARRYFDVFGRLLRSEDERLKFSTRSRRPPRDPVNACLSFFYTMLARDMTTACESVGLDPQMGYLHACRPGRMSLALDLMEELRAPYVDRFVLSLFNRKQIGFNDFHIDASGGVFFKERAMKKVLGLWQAKKQEGITHPFLKERMTYGLIPFVQAQLFARYLRGDLSDYPAYMWR